MTVKIARARSPHHRRLRSERPLPAPVGPIVVQGVASVVDAPDGSLTMIVAIELGAGESRALTLSPSDRRMSTAERLKALGSGANIIAIIVPGEACDRPLPRSLAEGPHNGFRQTPLVPPADSDVRCGDVEVDCEARVARISGERVLLQFAEFELLLRFVRNQGKALTRKELMGASDGDVSPRIVDVRVARLRRRLAHARGFAIETVTRVGYRCVEATPA